MKLIPDDSVEMDETLPSDPVPNYEPAKSRNMFDVVAQWIQDFVSKILIFMKLIRIGG